MSKARIAVLLVAVTLAASGCAEAQHEHPAAVVVSTGDPGPYAGAELSDPYTWPDVTLTDTGGSAVQLAEDVDGPVTVVFFGFTNCEDACPLAMATIATAVNQLDEEEAGQVDMLFITTDPPRDDPATLRAYLDRYNPRFEGVTGDMADIRAAASALGVPLGGRHRLPGGGYDVGHGGQIIGFLGDRAPVVWTEGTAPADLADDLSTLVERAGT